MNFAAGFSLRTCKPSRYTVPRILPNPSRKSPFLCRQASTKRFAEAFSADRDDYRKALPAEWAHLPLELRWVKPTLFFVGTSCTLFVAAAYASNAETDADLKLLEPQEVFDASSNKLLKEVKYKYANRRWNAFVEEARRDLEDVPIGETGRRACAYIWPALRHPLIWCNARARSDAVIIAALTPLMLAWYIPRLHPTLFRHWTHSLRSGKSYTMLTSLFSHQQVQWLNVIAAGACVPLAAEWFAEPFDNAMHESSPWYHLSAFFITAGMFSMFAPQFITYIRFRSAFKQLVRGIPSPYTNQKLNKALSYSLGISGALHACLTIPVFWEPRLALGPNPRISWRSVWAGVCAIEIVCMLASVGNIGWYANLCGVVFGALYGSYGLEFWALLRAVVLTPQFWDSWERDEDSEPVVTCGESVTDLHPLFRHQFLEAMDKKYKV